MFKKSCDSWLQNNTIRWGICSHPGFWVWAGKQRHGHILWWCLLIFTFLCFNASRHVSDQYYPTAVTQSRAKPPKRSSGLLRKKTCFPPSHFLFQMGQAFPWKYCFSPVKANGLNNCFRRCMWRRYSIFSSRGCDPGMEVHVVALHHSAQTGCTKGKTRPSWSKRGFHEKGEGQMLRDLQVFP